MISQIAEYAGYLATVVTGGLAVLKWLRPWWSQWKQKRPLFKVKLDIERLKAKFHLLIALRGDAVYACDPEGNNIWVSDALAKLFGLSSEQMRQNGWASAIEFGDQHRAVDKWKHAVETKSPYRDQYIIVANGKRRLIETEAFRHENEHGDIVIYVGWASVVKELEPAEKDETPR